MPVVPEGEYVLFAGTDMNNDMVIDNEGEAFGGYPVLSYLEKIDATEDISGISFSVNYFVNLQTPTMLDGEFKEPSVRRLR
jgi:hypothetical protein